MSLKQTIFNIYAEARREAMDAIKSDFLAEGFIDIRVTDNNPYGPSELIDFSMVSINARYKGREVTVALSHSGYSFRCSAVSTLSQGAHILANKLDKVFGY